MTSHQILSSTIIAPTGLNLAQQGHVEVVIDVKVIERLSWGTQWKTYRVLGKSDPTSRLATAEQIAMAEDQAISRALAQAEKIEQAQPDYRDPPRY